MSHQSDRGKFVEMLRAEAKVPESVSLLVMRNAATIQRLAVMACSDEGADRDRVHCPARWQKRQPVWCLCRDYGAFDSAEGEHGRVPRYMVQDARAEARITKLLEPYDIKPVFGGDPRGACVKLTVPSGRTDDWGQTGLCVPTPRY